MMDKNNFEQIALPHMPVLHKFALRLTMNSDNAKDLLQDTYLRAYRFWNKYEEGSNIRAWLYRIMKNSYINIYRKEIKEPIKISYEEYHLPFNETQETFPVHRYMPRKSYNEIFGDKIAGSIGSLKDSFRNILVLSDVEGLTYKEIAEIVGCPVGTIRSRLHRGRRELKKKLFSYAAENGYIPKSFKG